MEEFHYVGLFYCVNDNIDVDLENSQIMDCILYHDSQMKTHYGWTIFHPKKWCITNIIGVQ
jgi:hypothetical protein